jgi:2-oxoglutarate ferredoxin oxidoreductase subunit gamma
MRQEIRIGGFGGQGVITAAFILGKAAAVYDNLLANQTQSYGPEARGGAAKAEVVISNTTIGYPFVLAADVLAVMSQEAFARYRTEVSPSGIVIVDPDMVADYRTDHPLYTVHATKEAEALGNKVVANIVMLGSLVAIARPVSREAIVAATLETVPSRFQELNRRALDIGFQAGELACAPVSGLSAG